MYRSGARAGGRSELEGAWLLRGRWPLRGTVRAAGSKYAALAAIPASLLADEPVGLGNVPDTADTRAYASLLRDSGATVECRDEGWVIDPRGVRFAPVPPDWADRLRASYYMLGVQLTRWGRAEVGLPGGDRLGRRPIDLHVKVLRSMGADVEVDVPGGVLRASRARRLHGADIHLDTPSVGATVQAMICGALAQGETRIANAYAAAFIADLARLLRAMGADIRGAGTPLVRVRGVGALHGCTHTLQGDHAEAFTYLAAAAASGGEVKVVGVAPADLRSGLEALEEAGAETAWGPGFAAVRGPARLRAVRVTTGPLPAFFTDFQPPLAAALATARGCSSITETVWPERFSYAAGLAAMGAHVRGGPGHIAVGGVPRLHGRRLVALESRAAAAYVVAGLCAVGITRVEGIEHLDRVYSGLAAKLRSLGARLETGERTVPAPEAPAPRHPGWRLPALPWALLHRLAGGQVEQSG